VIKYLAYQSIVNQWAHSDTGKYDRGLKTILHDELHWLNVHERIECKLGVMVSWCLHDRAPRYLADHLVPASDAAPRRICLWSANLNRLTVPRCRLSTYGCRAFYHAGPTVWNSLPNELRNSDTLMALHDFWKQFFSAVTSVTNTLEVL